jgi:hypothetical protein
MGERGRPESPEKRRKGFAAGNDPFEPGKRTRANHWDQACQFLLLLLPNPTLALAATFTTNALTIEANGSFEGRDVVASSPTLTGDGPHSFNSLLLTNGAMLTHFDSHSRLRNQIDAGGVRVEGGEGDVDPVVIRFDEEGCQGSKNRIMTGSHRPDESRSSTKNGGRQLPSSLLRCS